MEIASTILKIVGVSFNRKVTEKDVKYLQYAPFTDKIGLKDIDHRLGHMLIVIGQKDLASNGISIEDFTEYLGANKAQRITPNKLK